MGPEILRVAEVDNSVIAGQGEGWDKGYSAGPTVHAGDAWFLAGRGMICKGCHYRHNGSKYLEPFVELDGEASRLRCRHCQRVGYVCQYHFVDGDIGGFNCQHEQMRHQAAAKRKSRAEERYERCCDKVKGVGQQVDQPDYAVSAHVGDTHFVLRYQDRSMDVLKDGLIQRAVEAFAESTLVKGLVMRAPKVHGVTTREVWHVTGTDDVWGDCEIAARGGEEQGDGFVSERDQVENAAGIVIRGSRAGVPSIALEWVNSIKAIVHTAPRVTREAKLERYLVRLANMGEERTVQEYGASEIIRGERGCSLCQESEPPSPMSTTWTAAHT